MTRVPFRFANLSEAVVPSTVTTRLPLPLVRFQKPLLQVLICISLSLELGFKLLSTCPLAEGIQPLVLQLALELLQAACA